jgi:hypothetical protein
MPEGLPTPARLMPELDVGTIEQIDAPDRSNRYLAYGDDRSNEPRRSSSRILHRDRRVLAAA